MSFSYYIYHNIKKTCDYLSAEVFKLLFWVFCACIRFHGVPVLSFPPGEKGKSDAAESAKCFGSLDFGVAAGSLASPGDVRTFRCISHRDCGMRTKVVFVGNAPTEGFQVFVSLGEHEGDIIPLPKGFKGISAEFSSAVDSFIGVGGHQHGYVAN